MKIYAPVKDANGVYASVRFVNGVGETDNPRLIQWFKSHGYTVERGAVAPRKPVEKVAEPPVENDQTEIDEPEMMGYAEKKPDLDNMTPYELREYALENNYKVGNIRSKERLLEIIRG